MKFSTKSLLMLCFTLLLSTSTFAQAVTGANTNEATTGVAENRKIGGRVTDAEGNPLPGVNVIIDGTMQGSVTDVDGKYGFIVSDANNQKLKVSFVGYGEQVIPIGDKVTIDVVLGEDAVGLDEVVVTALGIKREKKALGYAVQKIDAEQLVVAKGTNVATNITGKVAGLFVRNSTEFGENPSIQLRGATDPLIVVDGVAYSNFSLNSISADDIESMDILKGATAAALYGTRGRKGAIMITTKSGQSKKSKLKINVSNNTMFRAGYLRIPERQTSYSSGEGGVYRSGKDNNIDFVWGAYMHGQEVEQWNPIKKKFEKMPLTARGKNNLENFLENSYIMNNNVSISQSGELGGFRASATQIHNKGDYPNTKLDKYIMNIGGNINYDKFKMDASVNYSKEQTPNVPDRNYGASNIIYNMIVWTGPEYDIRDFKDYWIVKDQEQNWHFNKWYDNPYVIVNERKRLEDEDYLNGKLELSYELPLALKATMRTGYDSYSRKYEDTEPISMRGTPAGSFSTQFQRGFSLSNDFLLTGNYKIQDLTINVLGGLSSYYFEDERLSSSTTDGLSIPGFYSLRASVGPASTSASLRRKLVYGVYGKLGLGYKSLAFVDVTGRNDWSSTLPEDNRAFFYPSVSASFIPTELYNPVDDILDYFKLRGSWAVAKKDLGIHEINRVFSISQNAWNGLTRATYPGRLRDPNIEAETERTIEFGVDVRFLKNRIGLDVAYFNRLQFNRIVNAGISNSTGFGSIQRNSDEEHIQKGMEYTLTVKPIVGETFNWNIAANIAYNHWYYHKLDPQFSSKDPRIKEGGRLDQQFRTDWEKDPQGNLVLRNGLPVGNNYESILGTTDPDFFWGITNSFSYDNFQVSFSFDGRVGGLVYNWTEQALWNTGAHPDSDNQYRFDEYLGKKNFIVPGVKVISGERKTDPFGKVLSDTRKFAPNDVKVAYSQYVQKYHGNAYTAEAQNYMEATFFKLREVAFNYNLPKEWIEPIGMNSLQVGVVGQNLWLWSPNFEFSDPDRGTENLNSPAKRFLGFNINMTF